MKVKLKMLALFFSLIDNTEYMSQSNSEKDFHTGIPAWAPKFWCPKNEIYLYLHLFYITGYASSL